jgi:hypothetical protein
MINPKIRDALIAAGWIWPAYIQNRHVYGVGEKLLAATTDTERQSVLESALYPPEDLARRSLAIHHCSVASAIPRRCAKLFCAGWLRSNSATVETQNSRPRRIGPAKISYSRANYHAPFFGRIRSAASAPRLRG